MPAPRSGTRRGRPGLPTVALCVLAGLAAGTTSSVAAAPAPAAVAELRAASREACPAAPCGSHTVAGLGARKQEVLGAGATSLDLAAAMLETVEMRATYAYGDNKTQDAANFGIFKQNWGMIRTACSQFRGQRAEDWNNGAALNQDLSADLRCLHESQAFYGLDRWFAGHRNGSAGLADPNTPDIRRFAIGILWTQQQIDSGVAGQSNDVRVWLTVPAI